MHQIELVDFVTRLFKDRLPWSSCPDCTLANWALLEETLDEASKRPRMQVEVYCKNCGYVARYTPVKNTMADDETVFPVEQEKEAAKPTLDEKEGTLDKAEEPYKKVRDRLQPLAKKVLAELEPETTLTDFETYRKNPEMQRGVLLSYVHLDNFRANWALDIREIESEEGVPAKDEWIIANILRPRLKGALMAIRDLEIEESGEIDSTDKMLFNQEVPDDKTPETTDAPDNARGPDVPEEHQAEGDAVVRNIHEVEELPRPG